MRRVRHKDTSSEMKVRRLVFSMGYRYRLHRADLPGKPDLAFPGRRKVIFVHGCFWHRHDCRSGRKMPKTNAEYWSAKLSRNAARDAINQAKLRAEGWDVLVLWECELREMESLGRTIRTFLEQEELKHE